MVAVQVICAIGIFCLAQWVSRNRLRESKSSSEYSLASLASVVAICASLIAANICAQRIVGRSG